jgi:hypothetical protein
MAMLVDGGGDGGWSWTNSTTGKIEWSSFLIFICAAVVAFWAEQQKVAIPG